MARSIIIHFKGANMTELIWQFNMQTMTSTNLAAKLAHTCRLHPFQSPRSRYTYSSLCCWRTPGVPECMRALPESTHWYLVSKLKRATIENFSWNWMSSQQCEHRTCAGALCELVTTAAGLALVRSGSCAARTRAVAGWGRNKAKPWLDKNHVN